MNEQIRVSNDCDKAQIGSCNACTDRDSYEKVTEVQLRGMSFRLCDRCKVELVGLLKKPKRAKKFDPLDHNQCQKSYHECEAPELCARAGCCMGA